MVFSSVPFLYVFLPVVLLGYFLVPRRFKNVVLLAASLFFYYYGERAYTSLLLISSLSDYLHSLYIEKHRGTQRAKAALISSIAVNLALLGFFKYADFLISTVNSLLRTSIPLLKVPLPIGISFFTFQTMSYTIDVYRGRVHAQKNLVTMGTFVCLFPQLVAGPIVRYSDIALELEQRSTTLDDVSAGARRFVFGLAKKVLIANNIGLLWDSVHATALPELSALSAWLGIIAYSLQLYFDFAGYSEMSNGLAALLGFDCPANFNLPYISGSITEFWRRWHITLSGWFRDYIYIPLGGNRKGQARQLLNMFLVWAATGIWHGASWNFIAWGLYYFVLLTIEKTFLLKYLKKGKVWPHIYTLFFVVLGWGIFTANQPGAPLGLLLQKLFVPQGGISPVYYLRNYGVLLVLGCVCSSALPHWLWEKISKNTVAKLLVFALLTALCVCYVVAATNATALYANF